MEIINADEKRAVFLSRALLPSVDEKRESERRYMATAIDPVCEMQVDEQTAAAKSEYQGQTYYFCSPGCKRQFDKDPERYLRKPPAQ